uniref:HTH cro/C1-type domain-containing protein n=1 Tax=viral metagenome TaxID=1070528 RepID=A0A6C0B0A8_9ZZZZ
MQDWKTVTLNKMGTKQVKPVGPQINPLEKRARLLDAYNAGPAPKIEKVSPEDKRDITQLRILKRMTQSELDKQLNLKKDTIKTIENGTHEKNKQLIQKIKAFLTKV